MNESLSLKQKPQRVLVRALILEERGYSKEKIRLGWRRIGHEKEEEEINIF